MKSMRKIAECAFLLIMGTLVFSGCEKKTAGGAEAPSGQAVPVVVLGEFDPQISGQQIIAQEKGFFEEEGLKVDLQLLTDPSISTVMVASGEAQFYSISNYQAINLADKGSEVVLLAPVVNAGNTQVVVAGPQFNIARAKDLEGKKMGYTDGAGVIVAVKNMCNDLGVNYSAVQLVNLQAADMLAALESGQIDCFAAWEPWGIKAEEFGAKTIFTGTKSYLPENAGDVNYLNFMVAVDVSKQFVTRNPEACKSYLRAMIKATDYINGNLEDAAAIIARRINLDTDTCVKIMKKNVYAVKYDNTFKSACDELAAYMKDSGLNTSLVAFSQYTNTDILKSVNASLVSY
jgi:NitT/TauT family transport system substrate-binding protein